MDKKVGIVGAGAIATRLRERLKAQGDEVCFSVRRNHTGLPFDGLIETHMPEVVFVAISTLDNGEAALNYILECVMAGVPVITCEKGALAYHAEKLKPYLNLIRYSAAVGGGTGMLDYIRGRHPNHHKSVQIDAVLNGTLNFVFDEMSRGRTLGEACSEAAKLGYAEPGATDPRSLINGELADVERKACVFFNTLLAREKFLTPHQLQSLRQSEKEIQHLADEGSGFRMIISFSNQITTAKQVAFLGAGFTAIQDGWHVSGGFRKLSSLSDASWVPGGVGNAVHIIEGALGLGGKYTLSGPGAGVEATTSAMLNDFFKLCP